MDENYLERLEIRVKEKINQILNEDFDTDPLGFSILLYFLLKNQYNNEFVDNLIKIINFWVEKIIIKKEITKFIDRDVTSSLFSNFILTKFNIIDFQIKNNEIKDFLEDYYDKENHNFFNNNFFTILNLISIENYKLEIKDDLNLWLRNQLDRGKYINDLKNYVFLFILFQIQNDQRCINKLFEKSMNIKKTSSFVFYDRIYLSWILIQRENKLNQDIEFHIETLKSFGNFFEIQEISEISDIYGQEIEKKISKLSLGVFFDLLSQFKEKCVVITKDQYEDLTYYKNIVEKILKIKDKIISLNSLFNSKFHFPLFKENYPKLVVEIIKIPKNQSEFKDFINSLVELINRMNEGEMKKLIPDNLQGTVNNLKKFLEIISSKTKRSFDERIISNLKFIIDIRRCIIHIGETTKEKELQELLRKINFEYPFPPKKLQQYILDIYFESLNSLENSIF
ncbi:MAG: hypothetical protein ACTSWX_09355 [Promethearchaeota archaeon]